MLARKMRLSRMRDEDFELGNPDNVGYYPGEKPIIERHVDYASMARGFNYPFDEDIDYDPRIDEEQDDE